MRPTKEAPCPPIKRAVELGRRRHQAAQQVIDALKPLGDGILSAWKAVKVLERAAFACGEERERRRRAK